ncbi:hypothetical protein BS47DRAFT_412774 [Hydnum rufescens UP504]|uniref:Uncharacterized protein n=1 Tax=Hydnum rufescens UP504 TaxID=1448309 RepID=A0A9P6BDJ4_9AGAM|nr:hypothetical protein BS47DRAFT_412774 [Hydnum rufescens UP504]
MMYLGECGNRHPPFPSMSIRTSNSTTTLPQSLLDKIKADEGSPTNLVKLPKKRGPSRKEARKQEREAKKQRKAQNHSHPVPSSSAIPAKSPNPHLPKRKAPQSRGEEASRKRPRLSPEVSKKVSSAKTNITPHATVTSALPKSKTPNSKTTTLSIDPSVKAPDRAEREETRKIAWLEGQLGIKKSSRRGPNHYGADFAQDGLDELLLDVDRILAETSTRPVSFPDTI